MYPTSVLPNHAYCAQAQQWNAKLILEPTRNVYYEMIDTQFFHLLQDL
jgi:hypothetical protein